MKHLLAKLKELESREFDVVLSRGTLALHQTQRNQAKAEIIEAIFADIKDAVEPDGYQVYQTSYGPVLEFLNERVEDKIFKMVKPEEEDLYTGFISVQIDAIMKNLDTNGALDQADYIHILEEKKTREAEREKAKALKTQRDAELRAEKARRREEEIARLAAIKEEQDSK